MGRMVDIVEYSVEEHVTVMACNPMTKEPMATPD